MNLKQLLSKRISKHDIHEIIRLIQGDEKKRSELFNLLFDPSDKVSFQAAWVMSHFSLEENEWLFNKQDKLIDEVLICQHAGKRRLILAILYRQSLGNYRGDFLDFCLERMITFKEPSGVRSLCMKIAYEFCRLTPELLQEFVLAIEVIEEERSPAITVARKNILTAIQKGKSLQVSNHL